MVSHLRLELNDLANVRFAHDTIWETTASMCAAADPRGRYIHREVRARAVANEDFRVLRGLFEVPGWVPDIFAPPPCGRRRDPLEELSAIAGTDADIAASDLEVIARRRPGSPWAALTPAQYAETVATRVTRYWTSVLAPVWEEVEAIVTADIAFRSDIATRGGLSSVFQLLSNGITFDAGVLRFDTPWHSCKHRASGRGIMLVPSVFRWERTALSVDVPGAVVVGYPARGAGGLGSGELRSPPATEGLGALLGKTRAVVLHEIETPKTTSGLSRDLSLSMGTVSAHLTTLASAGLAKPVREGRSVLYIRTPLGSMLANGADEFDTDILAGA